MCVGGKLLYACVIINLSFIANFAYWPRVNAASFVSASIVMAKKLTTRCSVLLSELCEESTVS